MFIILIKHLCASRENLTKCHLRYFLHSENDMRLLCQFRKLDKNIIFTKKVDLIFYQLMYVTLINTKMEKSKNV